VCKKWSQTTFLHSTGIRDLFSVKVKSLGVSRGLLGGVPIADWWERIAAKRNGEALSLRFHISGELSSDAAWTNRVYFLSISKNRSMMHVLCRKYLYDQTCMWHVQEISNNISNRIMAGRGHVIPCL